MNEVYIPYIEDIKLYRENDYWVLALSWDYGYLHIIFYSFEDLKCLIEYMAERYWYNSELPEKDRLV